MFTENLPAVLVADDNEATCTLVNAILRKEFRVDVAGDGREALEKIKSGRYAAVLLDLKMPKLDGYTVIEDLQRNSPEMVSRILIFTAALSKRDLARVQDVPVCGIVRKPFEVDELLDAVRRCAGTERGDRGFADVLAGPAVLLFLANLLRLR